MVKGYGYEVNPYYRLKSKIKPGIPQLLAYWRYVKIIIYPEPPTSRNGWMINKKKNAYFYFEYMLYKTETPLYQTKHAVF
jgi:hypothetical protein